jgi:hypothetical protein
VADQHDHNPYRALSILDDHGILAAHPERVLQFVVHCCHTLASALPPVAHDALAVADAFLAGRATAEHLTTTRVTLWQHIDTHRDRLTASEVAGMRAVICCLYEPSTMTDPYDHAAFALDCCTIVMNQPETYYQVLCARYPYPDVLTDASRRRHHGDP